MSAVIQFADYRQQPPKQPEQRMQDGFVMLPNSVLRAAKGRLKGLRLLAMIAVIEKTLGFQKDKDEISDSQIAKEWDCDRECVGHAITGMIEDGILILHGEGRYGRILSIANPENWSEITCGKKPQHVRQKAALGAAKSRNETGKKPHSTDNYQQTNKNTLVLGDADDEKVAAKKSQVPACPHQQIIDAYHASLPTLPAIKLWTDARQKQLQSRWRERFEAGKYTTQAEGIDYWTRFFAYVAQSDFLCGRSGSFRADLEWLTKAGNFAKVAEGKYENREAAQ